MRIHYLDPTPDRFLVSSATESKIPLAANIPTLYALEEHVPASDLATEGATLIIGKRNLATPLGVECFKHCVYLNTVYCSYPSISPKVQYPDGRVKPEDYEHHFNSMKNLPVFHRLNHVAALAKASAESPALIIQPGPSLDIEFIRSIKDRCVTIAIGRALPVLLEQDIVPDIIYQQDTSRHSWDDCFGTLKGRRLDSLLVANPVGHIRDYFPCFSRVFKSWNFFPFEADRFPHVLDSIAPSTTTGAFSLALHLGSNPLILHGGDFGKLVQNAPPGTSPGISCREYNQEGDPLVFKPLPRLNHEIFLSQPDGTRIWTTVDYLSASQWIKRKALSLIETHPKVKVYDRSSTGLLCVSSIIEPFRPEVLEGRTRRLEFQGYATVLPWTGFVRELVRRYTAIRRILHKTGLTPEISLTNPYNSIYTGMDQFSPRPFALSPEQLATALVRADELIVLLESLLAEAARN